MTFGTNIFSLHGKTALITGATGYLGRAMAFSLAEAGANVLVNSRSEQRCCDLVAKLLNAGLLAEAAVFDVCDEKSVYDYFDTLSGKSVDVLVNNAYFGSVGSIEVSTSSSYLKSYEVTLLAAHNVLKAALPGLRLAVASGGDASVINIASMYGLVSPDQKIYSDAASVNPPFYGAAKAGLIQWTRYAACEFGIEGIRVNSISPGPFPSPEVHAQSPLFIDLLSQKVPMGRVGLDSELKGPVLFLASSASSFVNGSNLVVDGGWTAW